MNRTAFGTLGSLAVVLLGGVVAALVWAPRPASACTGPSAIQQMASSPMVFTGRITAVEEDPAVGDTIYRGFRLWIDVTEGMRGVSAGERLQVIAKVPGAMPVMCPQFDRGEMFLGKFVVAGLYTGAGEPEFYRWGTGYLGLDPESPEYADALKAARTATGVDPHLPSLAIAPGSPRCGALVTVTGSNFDPGQQLLLNYPTDPDESGAFDHPTILADASGRFSLTLRLPRDWCPLDWFIEAYQWRDDGQIGGWPLALTPIKAAAPTAPLPPDAGNTAAGAGSAFPWSAAVGAGAALLGAACYLRARRS